VSSSLHGIIVAHAYGVPARWVRWRHDSGDGIKYLDYFQSVQDSTSSPVQLDPAKTSSLDYLEDVADAGTLPDHSGIRRMLVESCPFKLPAGRTLLP
jgi:hypothetical protein